MENSRAYYEEGSLSAAFYDLVTAADAQLAGDLNFYARLLRPGARVLELGTGSGRLAFGLAERGFAVTGVDLAPAMLAQATARLATAPPEIGGRLRFRLGDLTRLELGETFHLVLCPYFTLAHVPPGEPWRAAFEVMARHIAPGGGAAVHLPLPELMRGPGPADPAAPVLERPLANGGRLELRMPHRVFDETARRFDQTIEYTERDGNDEVVRRSLERLIYYADDPTPYAAAAGLTPAAPPIRLGAGDVFLFQR